MFLRPSTGQFHRDPLFPQPASDDDVPAWTPISDSDSNTSSHNVTGLMAENTYTFAVRAFNSQGDSDSSNSLSVTIVAAPAAPTGFTASAGDSHVELNWGNPGNSSITMYQYQQGANGAWTDIPGSGALTTSHLVSDLTNGTEYTFRVRAVNAAGEGAESKSETATPAKAGAAPDKPANFGAAQTGINQVELTWDAASQPRIVTGYQFTQNGGSSWTNIDGSDSSTVSHTVFSLVAETTYNFAVRAINSSGVRASDSISVTIVKKPGRPTGLGATPGDTQATIYWKQTVNEDAAPIDKYQLLQVPLGKLIAEGGMDNDEFGISVALDGSTVVVGVPGATNGTGAAYVFTKDSDGAWSQAATLTASGGQADDEFGISVALDGSTVVVGAPGTTGNTGAAYVFTKPGDAWVSTSTAAKLTASDSAANDEFGISVAMDGDTVVVGGDQGGNGAVYVFTKPGGAWTSTTTAAKLAASDGEANDEFGVSVAVDDDTAVVGAHLHDVDDNGTSIPNAGAAYVFTKPDDGWTATSTESAKLTAPDGAANDEFGISVAVYGDEEDGDTVLVGAHQTDHIDSDGNTVNDSGSAYVFDRDPESGKWSQTAKLTASNGDGGDGFGNSVAVDGDTAVVGAYLYNNPGLVQDDSGSVYVFTRVSDVWSETLNLAAPDAVPFDRFGYSIAVAGGTLLAGAPQDDDDASNSGSAYVMDISDAEWVNLKAAELTVSSDNSRLEYAYRVLGLTNDQEYAFRVRSVNAAGNDPTAETRSATPMLAKPGKPTGLLAEAATVRST